MNILNSLSIVISCSHCVVLNGFTVVTVLCTCVSLFILYSMLKVICTCKIRFLCLYACIVVMNELWNRGLYHALLQSCRVNHSPQLAIHLLNHMTERVSPTKYICISHHHQLVSLESTLPVSTSTSCFIFVVFHSSNVSACWHENDCFEGVG